MGPPERLERPGAGSRLSDQTLAENLRRGGPWGPARTLDVGAEPREAPSVLVGFPLLEFFEPFVVCEENSSSGKPPTAGRSRARRRGSPWQAAKSTFTTGKVGQARPENACPASRAREGPRRKAREAGQPSATPTLRPLPADPSDSHLQKAPREKKNTLDWDITGRSQFLGVIAPSSPDI